MNLTLRFSFGLVFYANKYLIGALEILWVFQRYGFRAIQVLFVVFRVQVPKLWCNVLYFSDTLRVVPRNS
jgi:hypothetical protein